MVPSSSAAGPHLVTVVAGGNGSATVVLGRATFTVVVPDGTTTSSSTTQPATTTTVPATTTTGALVTVAPPVPTVAPTQPTQPVQPTVPDQPTVTMAPPTCPRVPLAFGGFAFNPAEGAGGTSLSVVFDVGPGDACPLPPVVIAIDGVVVSGPLPAGPGRVSAVVVVPKDAAPGPHRVALVLAGDPSTVVASASFLVEATSGSSALPLAAGLVGLAVLAWAVVAVVRSRSGGSPPGAPADASGPSRIGAEEARLAAEEARAEVTRAQARARAAEQRAADLRERMDEPEVPEGVRPPLPNPLAAASSGRTGKPYLLEHENPHAPRRPNGKRGWYRTQRTAPVRSVVVGTAPSRWAGQSAGDVASGLSFAPRPAAAHVVVDREGVIELLPDDHVAIHRPEADEATIVFLVATDGEGTVDHGSVRQAASWCTSRARSHHVSLRRITYEEWAAGESGFLDARSLPGGPASTNGPDFPWDHFLAELQQGQARAIPDIVPGGVAAATEGDVPAQEQQTEAEAEAAAARREAEKAEQLAREAERRYQELLGQLSAWEARDVPTPEALLAAEPEAGEAAESGRYYLLEHENPSGPLRSNGKRGWYYPGRSQPVRGIVLHTSESLDAVGAAEGLTTVTRPSAAHAVVGTETSIALLPDEATAFHAPGGNSMGLGLEIAYRAAQWGEQPATEEMLLVRSAVWCGLRARKYGIPVRRVTVEEWEAGERGFISHAELDPMNRSDPGPDFPWDRFLALTARVAGRPPDAPGPAGEAPS